MRSIEWCRFQLPWVTSNPDFKVTDLPPMPSTYCVQLMRDLFAIAKFLVVSKYLWSNWINMSDLCTELIWITSHHLPRACIPSSRSPDISRLNDCWIERCAMFWYSVKTARSCAWLLEQRIWLNLDSSVPQRASPAWYNSCVTDQNTTHLQWKT